MPYAPEQADEGSSCYIEGEDVRVVIVRVKEGRIADWKGGVKDWLVTSNGEVHDGSQRSGHTNQEELVNGIIA